MTSQARPLVSVIVPNYNYARTLGLCLSALERQTYPHIEVIVVDDRSTDDSVEIARRHGVRVVETDTNIGAPAARNLGVRYARGEVLFFLDSDLALAEDVVEHTVNLLTSDPTLGVVCGTYDPEPLIPDSRATCARSVGSAAAFRRRSMQAIVFAAKNSGADPLYVIPFRALFPAKPQGSAALFRQTRRCRRGDLPAPRGCKQFDDRSRAGNHPGQPRRRNAAQLPG